MLSPRHSLFLYVSHFLWELELELRATVVELIYHSSCARAKGCHKNVAKQMLTQPMRSAKAKTKIASTKLDARGKSIFFMRPVV